LCVNSFDNDFDDVEEEEALDDVDPAEVFSHLF